MTVIYGIKNCDTVKKARQWLKSHGIAHQFIDFREDGFTTDQVTQWCHHIGFTQLINKRSTSWKTLSEDEKALFSDTANTGSTDAHLQLIMRLPTLIKRPLLEITSGQHTEFHVGFSDKDYNNLFSD